MRVGVGMVVGDGLGEFVGVGFLRAKKETTGRCWKERRMRAGS